MAELQNTLNKLMDNPIVVGILAIGVTVYGPRLSPKLPDFIRDAFNSGFFRFLIILLVIFVGFRSIRLAIVVAVLFLMIMSIANQQSIKEDFNNQVREYYANYNLFKMGNIEHFENAEKPKVSDEATQAMENRFQQELKERTGQQPDMAIQGNDIQNDEQGLYDEDEDDELVPGSSMSSSALNINNELQPALEFVNNPKSGMSSKCRSYWNTLANDSQGCIQEMEARISENPELIREIDSKMNGRNMGKPQDMGSKLRDIESKISQACAAFKGA